MSPIWNRIAKRVREMPADSLTMAVTTGLGFSVLAGIVSGVCYILTYGLPQTRRKRTLTPWQCSICGRHFRSIDGVLEVEKVATCVQCGGKSCKEKCATREPGDGWLCHRCKPETWFATLLNVLQPGTSKGWCSNKKMDQTTIDEIDEDLLELQKKEREQVRDFIERLVGALLGGDLDNVSVKKVYNDVKYDAIFSRYHDDISNALTDLGSALHISIANLPISGQSPCSTHATLKLLIQKFIQEAADLPKLQKFEDHPAIPDDTRDRTYEDLLSTAIINKVIQNGQQGAPSRSISSRASSRRRSDKEYFIGERNLDPRRIHDDTSSFSSLDSDSMSLKIRGCIKEVSSSGDETKDEDEVTVGRKNILDWQDNWHLQKRKYDGTTSPVPVPMLVPDPITEARVLIGDRDAEDTTDLSDAASDYEEALEPATLNAVLVNSRTVIGGRSPLESLVSKAESISEDGSTDTTDLIHEKDDIVKAINGDNEDIAETSNDLLIEQKGIDDASLISLDSNTEKDLEYTERYASLPRTIYKSPKPTPRQSKLEMDHFDDMSVDHELKTDNVDSGVTSDEDDKQKIFKGTYGEREKEKWNHAVPLSNNPYSKSNLERRLSTRSSNSSISSSFDRDYYIREAAKSTGARKLPTSPSLEDEVDKVTEIEEPTIEPKLVREDQIVFKAIPAIVQDEADSSIEPTTPTRPNHLDLSSDSDYSIERTYNLESGQILRKPNDPSETSKSPEGIKYLPKEFDIDENHNKLKLETEKRNFLRSLTMDEDMELHSSLPDSSFEEVRPPLVNHFKLVEEIANETSDQYDNTPLSPPAEYKTADTKSNALSEDSNFKFDEPPKSQIPAMMNSLSSDDVFINSAKSDDSSPDETCKNMDGSSNAESKVVKKFLDKSAIEVKTDSPEITKNSENTSMSKHLVPAKEKATDIIFNDDEVKFIQENMEKFKEKLEPIMNESISLLDRTDEDIVDFSLTYSEVSEPEVEINDLKEKKLVNNLLGEFSKSSPNLNNIQGRDCTASPPLENGLRSNSVDLSEMEDDLPSVRKLSKIFDSNKNGKQDQVYSLTARSIPKQFRQELMKDPTSPVNEDDKKIVTPEPIIEEKVLPFPKAKSKIEFFEKLKN